LRSSVASKPSAAPKSDAQRPPPPAVSYDFSDADKDSFRALAASVSFVGVCTLMFAGLSAVFACGELFMGFVPNGLGTALATGVFGVTAGCSLSAMVRTRGQDVERLMEAVSQLRKLFGLARVVIILLAMAVTVGGALVVWCNVIVEKGGKCFGGLG